MTAERVRGHVNVALFVPHAGCPHRCSFCDQRAIAGRAQPLTPQAVVSACERASATMRVPPEQAEIAFFGGSFTAMDPAYMRQLLEAAWPYVRDGRFGGIRVSTRPDAIDGDTVALLRGYGVTAVELGAQSMNDAVLEANGRGHRAADVVAASGLLRSYGLSVGLQMMTGLPKDSDTGAWQTARQLAALRPDTVRIYPTVVMRGTQLERWYRAGRYRPQTLEEATALCAGLLRYFEREQGIPVIRLGLHAGADLQAGLAAGPWHPAFRELCEGREYLRLALDRLRREIPGGGRVRIMVRPDAVSKMTGQRRCNLEALAREGYVAKICGDASLPQWEMTVTNYNR